MSTNNQKLLLLILLFIAAILNCYSFNMKEYMKKYETSFREKKQKRSTSRIMKDQAISSDGFDVNPEIMSKGDENFFHIPNAKSSTLISPNADSSIPPPPPCINNESQIAYVNGIISATQTFYNCLANIAEPMSLPTIYNGSANGILSVLTSVQLNNLHEVSIVRYVS